MAGFDPALLEARIEAAPAAPGAILALPRPEGDLERAAQSLAAVGARALLTLMPAVEAAALGLDPAALARACAARGIAWWHAPITDLAAPGGELEGVWPRVGAALRAGLCRGELVALHCRAGLGRSGTVAARLLVELGIDVEEAIARVRAARPGAIETAAQEAHLRALRPLPGVAGAG